MIGGVQQVQQTTVVILRAKRRHGSSPLKRDVLQLPGIAGLVA